jgi:hypothetical protein
MMHGRLQRARRGSMGHDVTPEELLAAVDRLVVVVQRWPIGGVSYQTGKREELRSSRSLARG